jgi:hypothetical protein
MYEGLIAIFYYKGPPTGYETDCIFHTDTTNSAFRSNAFREAYGGADTFISGEFAESAVTPSGFIRWCASEGLNLYQYLLGLEALIVGPPSRNGKKVKTLQKNLLFGLLVTSPSCFSGSACALPLVSQRSDSNHSNRSINLHTEVNASTIA